MTANRNGSFAGKVAFVTGAAGGIGRAAALAFAREGANVVVADVSEEGNQETARMIEDAGTQTLPLRCDVARAEEVKAALDRTADTFGRLDFAFNNAGVEQPIKQAADITEQEWSSTSICAVYSCASSSSPLMLRQGAVVIVNTCSGARVKGIAGQFAVCA